MEFPNRVVIQIKRSESGCYMYAVKASNGSFTVIVERNISTGLGGEFLIANIHVPYSLVVYV